MPRDISQDLWDLGIVIDELTIKKSLSCQSEMLQIKGTQISQEFATAAYVAAPFSESDLAMLDSESARKALVEAKNQLDVTHNFKHFALHIDPLKRLREFRKLHPPMSKKNIEVDLPKNAVQALV